MGRLLLIGHDPTLAAALQTSHHLKEHTVETSSGPFEAARLLRTRAFDVVLTDPSTSAVEDLALLKELREGRPGIKTILLAPTLTTPTSSRPCASTCSRASRGRSTTKRSRTWRRAAIEDSDWRDGIEVVSGVPYWITLRVSCRLITADRLTRFMTEYSSDVPSSERDLLMTAFREMLLNAMEHGAGFDPEKVIEVTAAQTARAIVFHFRDPGDGFDREDLRHAVATPNPSDIIKSAAERAQSGLRPGGFGMLIVRQIVDELVYNERGNEVLLIKHLK